MKKLYFLLVLAISFATQAQIVNIPDANFKAKLLSASSSNQIASFEPYNNFGVPVSYNSIDVNNNGEIEENEAAQIKFLNISWSSISNLTGIEYFINLNYLGCSFNQLSSININNLLYLDYLYIDNNQIINLNLNSNINIKWINCSNNLITNLSFQNLILLNTVIASNNQISNLNFNNLPNISQLLLNNNLLTNIDVSLFPSLNNLDVSYNQLINLDCNNNNNLNELHCNNNQLVSLKLKNGNTDNSDIMPIFNFCENPNMQYVCLNENLYDNVTFMNNFVCSNYTSDPLFPTDIEINSYCTTTPGPLYNQLIINSKLDFNLNGCDINDIAFNNLKYKIETNNTILYLNIQSNILNVNDGNYLITPITENPVYFNISPTSFVANFPTQASPLVQDFCVTANGTHHDVEVTLIPLNAARPGFNAIYSIIFKNKGNQVENGAVTLDFNDSVLDLVFTSPNFSSQVTNSLVWNYTNLEPFQTRIINLIFNVNSPTETPSVDIGDQLNYTATITPLTTDEFQYDNTSALKQIVVGSYDPNDKTCVEGTTVGPDMIGQYVHYVIRFENTGTFAAENVVVKDMIDLAKFDVNSLIPLHSSHDFVTRINGNKVEFIFEGINLPFDDANNDGYVAFKIKTKSNLVVGDTFSNDANIYFDYNFPITTNTFTTTIAALKVTDFDFGTHFTLYPNPVKEVLNFQSKDNTTINSIEIYNTLGQIVLAVPNAISTVDVSSLQSGNYFVKLNTDLGVSNTKFIKK
jgi:hypothetical protein